MTNLIQAAFHSPPFFADIKRDHVMLGISKLQAKIFHDFYGIKKIPIIQNGSLEELMISSIQTVLTKSKVAAEDVAYVIYAHTSLTQSPFSHNILRRVVLATDLTEASYFGFNLNKCAAAIEAISLVDRLLMILDKNQYVLLLAGDFAFTMQQRFLQNASMTGDAAGAVVFSKKEKKSYLQLLSTKKIVHPSFYKGAWIDKEKSKEFEEYFPSFMAEIITLALSAAGKNIDSIKYVLPHNVNLPIWKKISDKLGCDFNKIYTKNIEKSAHCFSTDFIINISSVFDSLEDGDLIVAVSVGFGLTFVSSVFKKINCGEVE